MIGIRRADRIEYRSGSRECSVDMTAIAIVGIAIRVSLAPYRHIQVVAIMILSGRSLPLM